MKPYRDPLNDAAALVASRVRDLPEFAKARTLVVSEALREIGSLPTVAHMRKLGGYTAVVRRAIDTLRDEHVADRGSKLFPTNIAEQLRLLDFAIASDVQANVVAARTRVS